MLADQTLLPHLTCTDLARAKNFYVEKLGLRVKEESEGHLMLDANGTPLFIYQRDAPTKADHTAIGWMVSDVTAVVKELTGRGVTFDRYPGFKQDEMGISEAPGGAKVAWFKDTEGNIVSVTQPPA